MAEKHGDVPRLGVLAHIAHERHDAHAPGQQQRGRVRLGDETVAQGTPRAHLVTGAQFGHTLCAFAHNLKKTDHVPGGHMAYAKGPCPGDFKPERLGTEHDKLARPPLGPFGAGKAQCEEAAFVAGLPKGHKVQNTQLA